MGCKSNQFESAIIEENLQKNGLQPTKDIKEADYYILNSCSVTHKSDNEAMYLLRAAKHKNPQIITILTGCFAQIEKENLLEYDFIDFVIGNDEKLKLYDFINSDIKFCAKDIMNLAEFNKIELIDTSKTRASLKIQDGCDNRCTYCIIWKARGKSRSADADFIIKQINNFSQNGFKEVMLTGIHIGQWGKDFGLTLLDLLKEIEEKTTIERYRLGSLNPTEITEEMLEFLSHSKKFCPHFHLSLQSANDKTLRSMNRFYKTEDYLTQIEKINQTFNLPFLGSDIIVGFAGETEEDFEDTLDVVKKVHFEQVFMFIYSRRVGTPGDRMENQIPEEIKHKRFDRLKLLVESQIKENNDKYIGTIQRVLVEGKSKNNEEMLTARTDTNKVVVFEGNKELIGNMVDLKIVSEHMWYLKGEIY